MISCFKRITFHTVSLSHMEKTNSTQLGQCCRHTFHFPISLKDYVTQNTSPVLSAPLLFSRTQSDLLFSFMMQLQKCYVSFVSQCDKWLNIYLHCLYLLLSGFWCKNVTLLSDKFIIDWNNNTNWNVLTNRDNSKSVWSCLILKYYKVC